MNVCHLLTSSDGHAEDTAQYVGGSLALSEATCSETGAHQVQQAAAHPHQEAGEEVMEGIQGLTEVTQ